MEWCQCTWLYALGSRAYAIDGLNHSLRCLRSRLRCKDKIPEAQTDYLIRPAPQPLHCRQAIVTNDMLLIPKTMQGTMLRSAGAPITSWRSPRQRLLCVRTVAGGIIAAPRQSALTRDPARALSRRNPNRVVNQPAPPATLACLGSPSHGFRSLMDAL